MTSAVIDLERSRRGALKALREGRVTIRSVGYREGGPKAVVAAGLVRGHSGLHEVSFMGDRWRCSSCGIDVGCAHALAVQLVTGHADAPSLLPPPTPSSATDDGECRHGMAPEYCADCTGRDGGEAQRRAERAVLLQRRGVTAGAFAGRCGRCGEPWEPGEPICNVANRWVASCCIEDVT